MVILVIRLGCDRAYKFIRFVTVIAIKYNVNVAGLHFILFFVWGAVTKKYSAIIQTFIF